METKKDKRVFNIIMVAIIIIIVVAGTFFVGSLKGGNNDSLATADGLYGIVNVERAGVSFELENGQNLQAEDKLTVQSKAGVTIKSGENTYKLAEKTIVCITDDNGLGLKLSEGETFIVIRDGKTRISAQENSFISENSVFSINVQSGSMGVKVFSGEVKATVGKENMTVKGGESISIVGKEAKIVALKAVSLNDFNLANALSVVQNYDICFTKKELNKVVEDRENEVDDSKNEVKKESVKDEIKVESSKNDENKSNKSPKEESNGDGKDSDSNETATSPQKPKYKCTVEIRCDTILNNMEKLTPGLEGYVPKNGTILKTTVVEFTEGENVFDVLKRVCNNKKIALEYSWTPMYNSYYVEGINHLYEFDCGEQSGWMYKVNGWFPNYGCSSYNLKNGDTIVWLYTCEGLGEDVGAERME